MNKFAFELIKKWEGCRLSAYQDGGGVWTIGYGHTGKDVHAGLVISQQQADALLLKDLAVFDAGVRVMVKPPLSESKIGAIICLSFNIGLHALATSTLLRKVNCGAISEAANEFGHWNKDNGKIIKGLTRRRAAEKELFLSA